MNNSEHPADVGAAELNCLRLIDNRSAALALAAAVISGANHDGIRLADANNKSLAAKTNSVNTIWFLSCFYIPLAAYMSASTTCLLTLAATAIAC